MNDDLVVVMLDDEPFGVPLSRVLEVLRRCLVTRIPGLAAHVTGLTNLRGSVIAVVDPRPLLGLPPSMTGSAALVVSDHASGLREGALASPVAVVVDAVGDIVAADKFLVHPVPANLAPAHRRLVAALVETAQGLVTVLDVDALLELHTGKDVDTP